MTELVVRRLLVDLKTPLPRHWCEGDAFRTALFNALSMSFPAGEQFFIDSVREGWKLLPADRQAVYKDEVQGFVGQEATHRRIHTLFNDHLKDHGLVNHWEPRILWMRKVIANLHPLHMLSITAAHEHFTAILADYMLRNEDMLNATEPRLKTMWLWHAAEESEHKTTAFDIYRELGGSEEYRLKWFKRVTVLFLIDAARQVVNNLWHDGSLFKWSTWKSAASYLFGQRGLLRSLYQPWKTYLRAGFHPNEHDATLSENWLRDNSGQFTRVGGTAPAATPVAA